MPVGFTLYQNAYRQGLDDAIRAEMVTLFKVLMSSDPDEVAVRRFTAGIDRTLKVEKIMKDVMIKRGIEIEVRTAVT